jgi:hypothetical protein
VLGGDDECPRGGIVKDDDGWRRPAFTTHVQTEETATTEATEKEAAMHETHFERIDRAGKTPSMRSGRQLALFKIQHPQDAELDRIRARRRRRWERSAPAIDPEDFCGAYSRPLR